MEEGINENMAAGDHESVPVSMTSSGSGDSDLIVEDDIDDSRDSSGDEGDDKRSVISWDYQPLDIASYN